MPVTTHPNCGEKAVCTNCQGTGTLVKAMARPNPAVRLPARSCVSRCAACKGTGQRIRPHPG